MKNLKLMAFFALSSIALTSCSNDDDAPVIENEIITTVTATFTPAGGGTAITLTSRDLDGDGPDAPVVTASGTFTAGASYTGAVTFLNETVSPAEDITAEIHELNTEHQIFFQQSGLGTIAYADTDDNGRPVGLSFTYQASATPVTGNLTLTLRHLPNKSATGVAGGDITNAGGSTDAEVTYPVTVQ